MSHVRPATGMQVMAEEPAARLDYFEIVNWETFDPVPDIFKGALAAVAAYVGRTRLIDNIVLMGCGGKPQESGDHHASLYSNLRSRLSKREKKARMINIDGIRYGWRSGANQFQAFREGSHGAALRIRFTNSVVGGWSGYRGRIDAPALRLTINLHRPGTAAALIRRALELGWSPDGPMTVEDGDTFIANLPTSVLTGIAY